MTKSLFYALLVLVCVIFTCSAQSNSCIGRCGEDYYRGYLCHCDYDCLTHNECCKDYEAKCTTRGSCKGRCGESFKRGRQCDCDSDCAKFGQCCPDYKQFCAAEVNATEASKKPSNSAIEGPNPCLNTHASTPAADPPMPEDSEAQSEGEDVNEDSGLSPTDPPYYEEQPTSPPPEDVINDIPEEAPVPEGSSGYEPLATSFPPAPIPTSAMTMPMTDMPGDAEAGLEADLEGEGLSLDGPTLHAVSDWSPAPASQVPTTVNPDSTPPPSNPSDPISTTSTPASEEQASTTTQTSAATEPTVKPTSEDPNPANSTPSVAGEPIVPLEEEANTAPADSLDLKAAPTVASTTPVEEANTPTPDDQEKPVENAASTEQPSALDNLANLGPAGTQEATESTAIPAVKPTEAHTASTIKPPTAGADGATAPTDQVQDSQPDSSDSQSPIAEPSDPEATVKPLEMTAMPGETTPEPVEKTTKSVETTAKPTEKTPNLLDTMAKPVEKTTKAPKVTPLPSKPTKKPEKPSSPNDIEFPGMDTSRDYQSDDSNDTNLCSGRPINGLTTLKNGTTVVFRGHYFWMLDALKTPGPAQGITETWGIPSPIDTVFTRCNCQGKTYFLKGRYYWRFENDVMDPGYPKAISRGFDGLSGHITAALSVPAYLRRRESVYFFKRGGRVQKYSYDPSKAPKCSGSQPSQPNHRVRYTVFSRRTRQAETYLGKELSIADAWKSFPATVTSAVSIPSRQTVDGYTYFVFTRTRHYNIRIDEERPTVTTPARSAQTQSFFNCPKKSQE